MPEIVSQQQVKYINKNINTNVTGTTANFPEVRNYTLARGGCSPAGRTPPASGMRYSEPTYRNCWRPIPSACSTRRS